MDDEKGGNVQIDFIVLQTHQMLRIDNRDEYPLAASLMDLGSDISKRLDSLNYHGKNYPAYKLGKEYQTLFWARNRLKEMLFEYQLKNGEIIKVDRPTEISKIKSIISKLIRYVSGV